MSTQDTRLPLLNDLADETLVWTAGAPEGHREDVADEVWAYALATFVDGTPVTPRGYDVSETFDSEVTA